MAHGNSAAPPGEEGVKNYNFYRALHGRGETAGSLARAIGSSRGHVTEVLQNKPGHGGQTRGKLARLLTPEELGFLGWMEEGSLKFKVQGSKLAEPQQVARSVPPHPGPLPQGEGEDAAGVRKVST